MSFFIFSRKLTVNYLVAFFIIAMGASTHSMSIDQIKGTYNGVHSDYRHLSLAHGAVWYETGMLKRYMMFGDKNSLITAIIKQLFIVHDDNSLQPRKYIERAVIGRMIGLLEVYKNIQNNKEVWLLDQLQHYSEVEGVIRDHIEKVSLSYDILQMIFLSLAYATMSTTQDFSNFHEGIREYLPDYCDQDCVDSDYFLTMFDTEKIPLFIQEEKQFWRQGHGDQNYLVNNVDKLFEQMVFAGVKAKKLSYTMPPIATYNTKNIYEKFGGIVYPDCFETVFRNLFNMKAYNQYDGSFSLKQLKDNLNKNYHSLAGIDDKIQGFYDKRNTKHLHARYINEIEVYNMWGDVLQNRPYVIYRNAIDIEKTLSGKPIKSSIMRIDTVENIHGFFHVTQDDPYYDMVQESPEGYVDIELHGKIYRVFDAQRFNLFEVKSRFRNVVILLNDLFGLNIFDNLSQELLRSDFNALYLPIVFERLGWYWHNEDEYDVDQDYYDVYQTMVLKLSTDPYAQNCFFFKIIPNKHTSMQTGEGLGNDEYVSLEIKNETFEEKVIEDLSESELRFNLILKMLAYGDLSDEQKTIWYNTLALSLLDVNALDDIAICSYWEATTDTRLIFALDLDKAHICSRVIKNLTRTKNSHFISFIPALLYQHDFFNTSLRNDLLYSVFTSDYFDEIICDICLFLEEAVELGRENVIEQVLHDLALFSRKRIFDYSTLESNEQNLVVVKKIVVLSKLTQDVVFDTIVKFGLDALDCDLQKIVCEVIGNLLGLRLTNNSSFDDVDSFYLYLHSIIQSSDDTEMSLCALDKIMLFLSFDEYQGEILNIMGDLIKDDKEGECIQLLLDFLIKNHKKIALRNHEQCFEMLGVLLDGDHFVNDKLYSFILCLSPAMLSSNSLYRDMLCTIAQSSSDDCSIVLALDHLHELVSEKPFYYEDRYFDIVCNLVQGTSESIVGSALIFIEYIVRNNLAELPDYILDKIETFIASENLIIRNFTLKILQQYNIDLSTDSSSSSSRNKSISLSSGSTSGSWSNVGDFFDSSSD